MSLEEYLATSYNRDSLDLSEIEETLRQVAETFVHSFDQGEHSWPDKVVEGDFNSPGRRSQGTSSMILAAAGKISSTCPLRNGAVPEAMGGLTSALHGVSSLGIAGLTRALRETGWKVESVTFGKNNPLTISQITEFLRGQTEHDLTSKFLKYAKAAVSTVGDLATSDPNTSQWWELLRTDPQSGREWCKGSSFVALRLLRAYADLKLVGAKFEKIHGGFKILFETRLHEQLSFSSIPDSRFDPAELAFSLEGLQICSPASADVSIFRRVLSVLSSTQETSAYWRPNRPFLSKSTGEIVLPLSVEGANSLLNAVQTFDSIRLHETLAPTALPMFRRFWQWLNARKIVFDHGSVKTCGWHSEHINEPNTIHVWDTSQVVEFLVTYRHFLQNFIANETLTRSLVQVSLPDTTDAWSVVQDKFEPVSNTEICNPVFPRVYKDFIEPWEREDKDRNYSMLIYGPPGTGKTTIASSIANALRFRLITVTVSDFLGDGGELVEARAKSIFQMLQAQVRSVIFFDELDSFLLDRNSSFYTAQTTLFQFLTPGMLTKINNLRGSERSIFIIATNYENRIDPAIKRPGRIDRKYLLLPPDARKRKQILKSFKWKTSPTAGQWKDLANASVSLGYSEIRATVNAALNDNLTVSEIIRTLKQAQRSGDFTDYIRRSPKEVLSPDEVLAMIKLQIEAGNSAKVQNAIVNLDPEHAFLRLARENSALGEALKGCGIKL